MAGAGMQHGDAGRRAWRENDLTTSLDAQSARGSGRRARPVLGRGRAGGRAGGRARRRPGRPVRPATGLSPSESPADRHAVATRGASVRVSVPCARTVRSGRRPGLQGEWTVLIPPQNGEKHRGAANCAHPGGGARPAGHGAPLGRHRPVPAHARVPGGLDSSDFGFRFFKSLTGQ